MSLGLYQHEPVFRAALDRCARIAEAHLGRDLRELIYPQGTDAPPAPAAPAAGDLDLRSLLGRSPKAAGSPAAGSPAAGSPAAGSPAADMGELAATRFAHPAVFVVSYALAKLWMSWGIRPQAMIGHSLGEYVAATLTGVMSLEEALPLVLRRSRLIDELPGGAMLAVTLSETEVRSLLGDGVHLSAINSPGLCVLAGEEEAVSELAQRLHEDGVAYRRLPARHAFHSPHMEPVAAQLVDGLRRCELRAPEIPFVSNVTGRFITAEEATDPDYWARHLCRTVRFADGLEELLERPPEGSGSDPVLLEVGPGQGLGALALQKPLSLAAQGPPEPEERGGPARLVVASLRSRHESHADEAFLLSALGRLWLAGVPVDWSGFYEDERRLRVALPSYPFERHRYWIEPGQSASAAAQAVAGEARRPEIADWFHLPSWRLSPLPGAAAQKEPERWLLFVDGGGLGEELASQLRAEGQEVVGVFPGERFERRHDGSFTLAPAAAEGYVRLLGELGEGSTTMIHCWSFSGAEDGSPGTAERFDAVRQKGFQSLFGLARALAKREPSEEVRLLVVADALFDVTAQEGASPEKAPLVGPCLVLPQEAPGIRCRVVDVRPVPAAGVPRARLARRLLAEARSAATDATVAYRGAHRWSPSFTRLRLEERAEPLRPLRKRGVYLLTGGLGAVGLRLAEILAREVQAQLALLDAGSFPEKERWPLLAETDDAEAPVARRLLALEESGAEVFVVDADVTDAAALGRATDLVEKRFGGLDGVLHAAGALTDDTPVFRSLHELDEAVCAERFRTTVDGVYALEEALRGRPCGFVLLCSSTASVLGGLGQCAVAASDRFMDAFAVERNRSADDGVAWISASWDRWPRVEAAEDSSRGTAALAPELAMTAEEGREALRRLLTLAPEGQVLVSAGDLASRVHQWLHEVQGRSVSVGARHARPELAAEYVAPRTELERQVGGLWQELLGVEAVGVNDSFFDLGGHSLLATQLASRLRAELATEVPLEDLFEKPTVARMAEQVEVIRWTLAGRDEANREAGHEEGEL